MLTLIIDWPTVTIYGTTLHGPDLEQITNNQLTRRLDIILGLDLQGGTYVALKGDMEGISEEERQDKLDATRSVIKNRVDQFGVSEANVYTSVLGDEHRIIVELPGAGENVEEQIDILRQTANLEFWSEKPFEETINLQADNQPQVFQDPLTQYFNPSDVSGSDLKTASAVRDSTTGEGYEIQLEFTNDGADKFNTLALSTIGRRIAIVLDGIPISQPVVNSDYGQGGNDKFVRITGSFSREAAESLAIQLRGGALPIPVEIVEQRTVEPTLGADALAKSLLAGLIGVVLLMAFMVYLYREYGIIADGALLIYILLNIALYKFIPITLTLAGVAGFIFSVGVAVDANILIFERMLEEIRDGRSKLKAAKLAFDKAWPSIRDSNGSTLMTCFILFYFGTSSVKAFAISLAIGVIIGLFTAVTITRNFMQTFSTSRT